MKKIISATLLAFTLLLTGCGGDSHDAVMGDAVAVMDEYATVLTDITDVESAKAAVPKIEAIVPKANAINERMKEVGEPTAEQKKELEAKYDDQMEKVELKMRTATNKIIDMPEVRKVVEDAIKKVRFNSW